MEIVTFSSEGCLAVREERYHQPFCLPERSGGLGSLSAAQGTHEHLCFTFREILCCFWWFYDTAGIFGKTSPENPFLFIQTLKTLLCAKQRKYD